MKVIFLLFSFFFMKALTCFINQNNLFCNENNISIFATTDIDKPGKEINIESDLKINNQFVYNLYNLPDGNIFISKKGLFNEIPQLTNISAPSSGQNVTFNGLFLLDTNLYKNKYFFQNPKILLDFSYDNLKKLYTFTNFPPGCGNFSISDQYNDIVYQGYYLPPVIKDIVAKNGLISISGFNLYKPQLMINGTNSLTLETENVDENLTSANFTYKEINYCGKWTLFIKVCNETISYSKTIINVPSIESINSVPGYGGEVTITGKNLYSRSLDSNDIYSGYSVNIYKKENDDKNNVYKKCSVKNYEKINGSIICNVPGVKDGDKKKNLILILTIDGEYSSRIIFSYESPSISGVEQLSFPSLGNALFKVTGNYLNDTTIKLGVMIPYSVDQYQYKNTTIFEKQTYNEINVNLPVNSYSGIITLFTLDGNDEVSSSAGILKFKPIIQNVSSSITQGEYITIHGTSLHSSFIDANGKLKKNENLNIQVTDGNGIIRCVNIRGDNGEEIQCLMGPGVGKDLTLTLFVDGLVLTHQFSYKPPFCDIENITQEANGTFYIVGNNFGNEINKISLIMKKTGKNFPVNFANHTLIISHIPFNVTGINPFYIKIGSPGHENVGDTEIVVKCVIKNVTSIPVNGGIVTFSGERFHKDYGISFKEVRNSRRGYVCHDSVVYDDNTKLECNVTGIPAETVNRTTNAGELKTTSGKNHHIYMSLSGKNAFNENNITFSFLPPLFTKFVVFNSKDVIIMGQGFNARQLNVKLKKTNQTIDCKNALVKEGYEFIECILDMNNDELGTQMNFTSIEICVDSQCSVKEGNFEYKPINPKPKVEQKTNWAMYIALACLGVISIIGVGYLSFLKYLDYRRIKKIKELEKMKEHFS